MSIAELVGEELAKALPFKALNSVQSKVFPKIWESDKNIVVSAPTGTGKTGVLDLAIGRLLSHRQPNGQMGKVVYVAPTRALCGERADDWSRRYSGLGLSCKAVTGETADDLPDPSVDILYESCPSADYNRHLGSRLPKS